VPIDAATGRGAGAINVGALAVDPNHPQIIYAGTGFGRENYGSGILKTTNGGVDWRLIASQGNGFDFFRHTIAKIIVDPTEDPMHPPGNTLYVAVRPGDKSGLALGVNDGIYRSADGGTTWTRLPVGQPVTDLEYTVSNNRLTLFAGVANTSVAPAVGNGGVLRSIDNGATWTPVNLGLPNPSQVVRIRLAADHTSGRGTVYAAVTGPALVNIYKSLDNGATWSPTPYPPGMNTPGSFQGGDALALSSAQRLYVASASYPPNHPGVFESNSSARDWQPIATGANGMTPHTDG
jgi:photosystem II stability/assembly factor-like uncharacterized protein